MAVNIQLKQFTVKTAPVPGDLVYSADSANNYDEVQTTIAELIGAYPSLLSIGGLTTAANQIIYSTGVNTFSTAPLTAFGLSILALNAGVTTPTAGQFATWDANKNLSANNLLDAYATTVTAAASTILTVASAYFQFFTGTTTQTVIMPVVSTLVLGQSWLIVNNSTGTVTIQSSGTNTIATLVAGESALVTCILITGTSAISWNALVQSATGGVTSLTGTANQVLVNGTSGSAQTGSLTLTLPQSIGTSSSPTFTGLNLSSTINGVTGIYNSTGLLPILSFTSNAGAVNYINFQNRSTGLGPIIGAVGSDPNVQLNLMSQGAAIIALLTLAPTNAVAIYNGTAYQHETIFAFANTSQSNTVTWQDSSGTVAYTSQLATPAALTSSNDTNVTITLGGTPNTALLEAVSLTMGWTGTLSLVRGGSGANLTASNGGIIYSTASAMAVLAGTATAGQILQSGASTAPQWSTTTYPPTNAINTIMYASSANILGVITPVNSSVLISSSGGVPSWSTTLPSGLAATNMALTTPNLGAAAATSLTLNSGTTLSTYSNGTWTPTFTSLTVVGTPTYVGTYVRIGAVVHCWLQVTSSTSTAAVLGTTTFTGLPYTPSSNSVMMAVNGGASSLGTGIIATSGTCYPPTWAASSDIIIYFTYQVATN